MTNTTSNWSNEELRKIAATDDLHVSPYREDGRTCGTPTWIWSVVVDNDLYVRAYNGQDSRWYAAAIRQKAGSSLYRLASHGGAPPDDDGPVNSPAATRPSARK